MNCKFHTLSILFACALVASGCSSSSDSGSGGGSSGSSTTFSRVFPSDMAITSPFAVSSTAGADIHSRNSQVGEISQLTYEEKIASFAALLDATDVLDCFNYETTLTEGEPDVACYGPSVTLSGTHPDGAITSENNPLPSGDLGIWEENEGDEACVAAKMNSQFTGVEGKIDFSMFTLASAICVANNSGLSLPAAGATLDLSSAMTTAIAELEANGEEAPITPTSISLSRLDNTSDGRPVYALSVTGSIENDDSSTTPVTMTMTHIPAGLLDNSTYQGLIQFTADTDDVPSSNCGEGNHMLSGSALYQKVSETDLRIRYRQAVFCGDATEDDIFDANGEADRTHKESGCPSGDDENADENGWGDGFTQLVTNADPSTGFSTVTYSWQAGRCDGQSRTFNAEISADGGTDGTSGGCGYFGFGSDISEAAAGDIDGMICNWAGPGSEGFGFKTVLETVQRQCVTLNADTAVYESVPEELNIAYAPTLNCDSDGTLLCDGVSCTTSDELLDITEMVFTAPTEPDTL